METAVPDEFLLRVRAVIPLRFAALIAATIPLGVVSEIAIADDWLSDVSVTVVKPEIEAAADEKSEPPAVSTSVTSGCASV